MNNEIQKELLGIKGDAELLQVDDVIRWARKHTQSKLHGEYNWNVKQAAWEHWRFTTRRLIQLHITYADGERKFVSLSVDRSRPGGGYRNIDDVKQAPSLMEVMLQDALQELERVRKKYERVKALAPVWQKIDAVRKRAGRRKGNEERRATA